MVKKRLITWNYDIRDFRVVTFFFRIIEVVLSTTSDEKFCYFDSNVHVFIMIVGERYAHREIRSCEKNLVFCMRIKNQVGYNFFNIWLKYCFSLDRYTPYCSTKIIYLASFVVLPSFSHVWMCLLFSPLEPDNGSSTSCALMFL